MARPLRPYPPLCSSLMAIDFFLVFKKFQKLIFLNGPASLSMYDKWACFINFLYYISQTLCHLLLFIKLCVYYIINTQFLFYIDFCAEII